MILKKIISNILLTYFCLSCLFLSCNQQKEPNKFVINSYISETQFYKKIEIMLNLIDSLKKSENDSIEKINLDLINTIDRYKGNVFNYKDTIKNDLIFLTKSKDNNLCLISWDTRQGGTNIDYATIVIYKTNQGIKLKYLADTVSGCIKNTQIHFDETHILKTNNRTIYLAHGFGQGSSALQWEEIKAFEIINNEINEPKIFPSLENKNSNFQHDITENKLYSDLCIEYDLRDNKDNFERPKIFFEKNNLIIKVPKVNDNGNFSNDCIKFEFIYDKYKLLNIY